MTSAQATLSISINKSCLTLQNRLNGKAYSIKQGKNRRNEALGAFITDEIKSSPERTALFLKYLAKKTNHQKKYGFVGLVIGGKGFYDREADAIGKVSGLIKSKSWNLDGSKMNEYSLLEIAAQSGLDIKENWHPREDGNWNSANSFTVTYLPTNAIQ